MAVEGATGAAEESGQEGEDNEAGGEVGPGEATPEAAAEDEPEIPELLTPTREELEAAFPNPPRAPTPILPDLRKMSPEQLEAAASQDVSYGGQVGFVLCSWLGWSVVNVKAVVVFRPVLSPVELSCYLLVYGAWSDCGGWVGGWVGVARGVCVPSTDPLVGFVLVGAAVAAEGSCARASS